MAIQTSDKTIHPLGLTTAYYISFIMLGLISLVEGPALPSFAKNTSSTLDEISLIFIFGPLGFSLGSYFGGRAYDRLSGHHLMAFTLITIAVGAFLLPTIQNLWLLPLILFILGLAKGVLDVGCNALLPWLHGKKGGPFMNGLHFFFGLGALLAPLILGNILVATGGILWTFRIFALVSLPIAV